METRTTCHFCTKPLTPVQIKRNQIFCSNKCCTISTKNGYITKAEHDKLMETKTTHCPICNKPLTLDQISHNAKACSPEHSKLLLYGYLSVEDYMKDRYTHCQVCGKPLNNVQISHKGKACSIGCSNKLRAKTNQGDQMKSIIKKPATGNTELKPTANTTTIPNTIPTVDQIINWLLSLSNDDKALLISAIFPTTDQIANWFLSLSNDDKALLINAIFPTKKIDDLVKAYDLAYPPVRPPLFNVKAGDYVFHPGMFKLQVQEAEKNWLWVTIQSMKIKVDLWGYVNGIHEGKQPIIWLNFDAYAEYAKGKGA